LEKTLPKPSIFGPLPPDPFRPKAKKKKEKEERGKKETGPRAKP